MSWYSPAACCAARERGGRVGVCGGLRIGLQGGLVGDLQELLPGQPHRVQTRDVHAGPDTYGVTVVLMEEDDYRISLTEAFAR